MRRFFSKSLLLLQIASTATTCSAFSTLPVAGYGTTTTPLESSAVVLRSTDGDEDAQEIATIGRRRAISKGLGAVLTTASVVVASSSSPSPANALVKGVAPPPKKSVGNKPKCTNVEECQALADTRADEERAKEESGPPPLVTKGGTKYRDLEAGVTTLDADGNDVSLVAMDGDDVEVYFKVLKLGKRSYDGLSGEGTVVFSRGYGLEDDETQAGQKPFQTTIGGFQNIVAMNEALVGMKLNGLRRFAILPQKGWEKATAACDGGPGGGGECVRFFSFV